MEAYPIKINNNMVLRYLELEDYDKGFLSLLSQLTSIGDNPVSKEEFQNVFKSLPKETHRIFVIEDLSKNIIIGTIAVIIEQKFIRQLGKCSHLEDLVVDKDYRRNQLGRELVEHSLRFSKEKGCYKAILDCSSENQIFYEKCGFFAKEIQMRYNL